jgi:fumarylacetoacetase
MTEPRTWLDLPPNTEFGLANLPYGVFSEGWSAARVGVRIGDHLLDLADALKDPVFAAPALNRFMASGRAVWTATRARITELLTDPAHRTAIEPLLTPVEAARLHLPFEVADYVDFYASEHHASNLGRILRPDADPLTPNWKHLPIGYHGRSGTVVVSGTNVRRPTGQRKLSNESAPTFGPSVRLDIEAEIGFVVGTGSALGDRIDVTEFAEHVFGVCLVSDWSARDLQAWEYVPLGPFLGKSFATSVSPWVVPLDALETAWVPPPPRDAPLLPYLADAQDRGLDLALQIELNGQVVSRPPFSSMYWTAAQMLAHMTVNGASTRTGDLYASGTVSGPELDQVGSFMELSQSGQEPFAVGGSGTRTFLEDGDVVTISASAPGPEGTRIGFGEVSGKILPATSPVRVI